jgi:hypothetical protein
VCARAPLRFGVRAEFAREILDVLLALEESGPDHERADQTG